MKNSYKFLSKVAPHFLHLNKLFSLTLFTGVKSSKSVWGNISSNFRICLSRLLSWTVSSQIRQAFFKPLRPRSIILSIVLYSMSELHLLQWIIAGFTIPLYLIISISLSGISFKIRALIVSLVYFCFAILTSGCWLSIFKNLGLHLIFIPFIFSAFAAFNNLEKLLVAERTLGVSSN